MIIRSIGTHKITDKDTSLQSILDRYVTRFKNKSVLAITSKIVAICEGRIVKTDSTDKDTLVAQEAQWYIPREHNTYGFCFTITNNHLIASAGIDESNGNGYFVLWPKNPDDTANRIREYLVKRFKIPYAGVIITDSHTVPFTWGVVGIAIGYSGFKATRNYIGTPDIFGKDLQVTHQSNIDGLAAAADTVMGGAAEQTPLAIIEDISFVEFQNRNPTQKERDAIKITREGDLFWPLMKDAPWKQGKKE